MTDSPAIRDRRLRIISGNPCARYASAASALMLSNGRTATVCARALMAPVARGGFSSCDGSPGASSIYRSHAQSGCDNDRQQDRQHEPPRPARLGGDCSRLGGYRVRSTTL